MTDFLEALRHLLTHLTHEAPAQAAWARLLETLVGDYPADASTLMVLEEESLRPVAVLGLHDEVRGRRFRLAEHPRLAAIAAHPGVCRFPPDSELPDPFDGLLDEGLNPVHDCLGVALRDDDERLTGLLTLDALAPGALAGLDEAELAAAAHLLGTCLRLADRLSTTRSRLNEALEQEAPPAGIQHWNSPVMRQLMANVALVAPTAMSVLLHGETGVGKELIARSLHARSERHQGPLVQVNCAALSESLAESALFGHRRGAFSGAVKDHRGHFRMADGGTLMLDEIGELPLALQAKLLRVLQEGEIQPLGQERPEPVDVRIVAVTNRDLAAEVAAGRFREDLYHRLGAFPLEVPPLRQRREDIPLLAGHFLEVNRIRLGLANLRLSPAAGTALLDWQWPGNIRELEHTLARAALRALADAPEATRRHPLAIQRHHLALTGDGAAPPPETSSATTEPPRRTLREASEAFQRDTIARALAAEGNNWAGAARRLGMDPGNLHRLARRLGLKDSPKT
ncbi:nitric oxide reductase transcriptional regulator NorR [Halomonas salifodinae]|uniref:nitric oxide reductase transcriptional regulator NorR n=1 Tax=Halomonas salifodinae TaxID=438745 RepID=UPI0033AADDB3